MLVVFNDVLVHSDSTVDRLAVVGPLLPGLLQRVQLELDVKQ